MPRDSAGNYTLPAGNPVAPDTIIETTWANSTMSDIALQLNGVVTRDGKLGPTAPLKLIDGTVGAPALAFNSINNSGFYRISGGIGVSWNGIQVGFFNPDGFTTQKGIGSVNSTATYGIFLGNDAARTSGYLAFSTSLDFYFSITDPDASLIFKKNAGLVPSWYAPFALNLYGDVANSAPAITIQADGDVDICTNNATTAKYHDLEVGWRDLPFASISGAGASPTIGQRGYIIDAVADVELPINVFSRGQVFTLNNNGATSLNITIAAGGTMRLAGTTTTGARVLAPWGMMTVVWVSGTVCKVSGPGVA